MSQFCPTTTMPRLWQYLGFSSKTAKLKNVPAEDIGLGYQLHDQVRSWFTLFIQVLAVPINFILFPQSKS